MANMLKLEALPINVQVKIASLIEKAEDRIALARVSDHCRMLAADSSAWRRDTTLVLGKDVSGEDAVGLVRLFSPGVKSVEYSVDTGKAGVDLRVGLLQALIEEDTRLRKIKLFDVRRRNQFNFQNPPLPSAPMMTKLMEYAASNGDLQSVSLRMDFCTQVEFPPDAGGRSGSLKEFAIDGAPILWSDIPKIMSAFPNLELLSGVLGDERLPPTSRLEADSQLLSKLKGLYLNMDFIADNPTDADVGKILSSCKELQALAIYLDRGLGNGNVGTAGEAISRMEKLVFLSLPGSLLHGVFKACQRPSFQFLRRLRLVHCKLTVERAGHIGRNCPNLGWFGAGSCHITDEALTLLLELCQKLQIFVLSCVNGLTGVGQMSLQNRAPDLKVMVLFRCYGVPVESAEQAAKDRPGVQVAYYTHQLRKVFRAARVGDEVKLEQFPARDSNDFAEAPRTGPNLRAIDENQVVPEGIVDYIVRDIVSGEPPIAQIHVRPDRDPSCYFVDFKHWII